MFTFQTPVLEIVVRVVLVYAGLFILVRLSGKKEIGQMGPMDLLAMLLLSETVSPALTGADTSVVASWTAAGTLLATGVLIEVLTHRWRRAERWIEGQPIVIIDRGVVRRSVKDRLRITDQELDAALRAEGLDSPSKVKCAVVETTGHITVVRRKP